MMTRCYKCNKIIWPWQVQHDFSIPVNAQLFMPAKYKFHYWCALNRVNVFLDESLKRIRAGYGE